MNQLHWQMLLRWGCFAYSRWRLKWSWLIRSNHSYINLAFDTDLLPPCLMKANSLVEWGNAASISFSSATHLTTPNFMTLCEAVLLSRHDIWRFRWSNVFVVTPLALPSSWYSLRCSWLHYDGFNYKSMKVESAIREVSFLWVLSIALTSIHLALSLLSDNNLKFPVEALFVLIALFLKIVLIFTRPLIMIVWCIQNELIPLDYEFDCIFSCYHE